MAGVALLLALAACSKGPDITEAPRKARLPATCDRPRFDAAAEQFESIARRRDAALARLESSGLDEAVHYLRGLEQEKAEVRELGAQAERVEVPRCLQRAREIFLHYVERTVEAMDARRPDASPADYRRARETADTIHGQFVTELKLQERNRQ